MVRHRHAQQSLPTSVVSLDRFWQTLEHAAYRVSILKGRQTIHSVDARVLELL